MIQKLEARTVGLKCPTESCWIHAIDRECNDDGRYRHCCPVSRPRALQKTKDDQRRHDGIAADFVGNGPKRAIDGGWKGVVLEHAGQNIMDHAKDVGEIGPKFIGGEVGLQAHGCEHWPQNERGKDNIDRKGWNNANATIEQKILEAKAHGAAGDQKTAERKKHGQNCRLQHRNAGLGKLKFLTLGNQEGMGEKHHNRQENS